MFMTFGSLAEIFGIDNIRARRSDYLCSGSLIKTTTRWNIPEQDRAVSARGTKEKWRADSTCVGLLRRRMWIFLQTDIFRGASRTDATMRR